MATDQLETLLDAVRYFADKEVAVKFLAALRWPEGVRCPTCNAQEATFLQSRLIWKCRNCRRQFSVKIGSLFEDSPIGLDKWLPALWLLVNCKNGISSYELARDLGVTQKTGWFMLHRLRLAVQVKSFDRMGGHVEIDETYIGGKARNMHKGRYERAKGRTWQGKTAVMGLLQRHPADGESKVKLAVIKNTRRHHLMTEIERHVEDGSSLYTDQLPSYNHLSVYYQHNVINHAESYAEGSVHTNGLENFWSLLKRAIKGTYVSVEPFHLFRYLDEQVYRFNNRKLTDAKRFIDAAASIFGKRLTYTDLTGNDLPETC